jgi:rhodanese-related sulfurtransferase
MIKTIKKIFGTTNYTQLIAEGAIIIDVRHKLEFKEASIKGSVNIPMSKINRSIPKLQKRNKVVITVSGTGMSSAAAKTKLKEAGIEVYNGGPWQKFAKHANKHAKAMQETSSMN